MTGLNGDNDLLSRFNALKPSTTSVETTSDQGTSEDDLAARFLRFSASEQRVVEPQPPITTDIEEDDKALEDLLADIGPHDEWLLGLDESKDIESLLAEAKASLLAPIQDPQATTDEYERTESLKTATDLSNEVHGEVESGLQSAGRLISDSKDEDEPISLTEEEEAARSLQRILDEISLENSLSNQDPAAKKESSSVSSNKRRESDENEAVEAELDLPSAPGTMPSSKSDTDTLNFDGLGLPSAPTGKPSKKQAKTNLPTYTNEEMESWCIICNDDATIRCGGCDNDLYCAQCWREGHTGPDAGYEEKRHKWAKYIKAK